MLLGVGLASFFASTLRNLGLRSSKFQFFSVEQQKQQERQELATAGNESSGASACTSKAKSTFESPVLLNMMHCICLDPRKVSVRIEVLAHSLTDFETFSDISPPSNGGFVFGDEIAIEKGDTVLLKPFLPHCGFCDKTLNLISVSSLSIPFSVTSFKQIDAAISVPIVSRKEESVPWRYIDGSLDAALFNSLCARVLALLADKPGMELEALHSGLMLLRKEHALVLLVEMKELGMLVCRTPSGPSATKLRDPFCANSFRLQCANAKSEHRFYFINHS
jgi:hypothetical protein